MLHLMNSAMMPREGIYRLRKISFDTFRAKLRNADGNGEYKSYIGYPENAKIISQSCGVNVDVSRADTRISDGDELLIMRLKYRPQNKGRVSPSLNDFEFFHAEFSLNSL